MVSPKQRAVARQTTFLIDESGGGPQRNGKSKSRRSAAANDELLAELKEVKARLSRIEDVLRQLQEASTAAERVKEAYTPAEAAELLGKRPYTVREWCRLGRVNARKRSVGRGDAVEWEISHEEIERYRNHGLLPLTREL